MSNKSPLKHKGSHAPYATEEAYHKAYGGSVNDSSTVFEPSQVVLDAVEKNYGTTNATPVVDTTTNVNNELGDLTEAQKKEIKDLRERYQKAGYSEKYIQRMVDIKKKHYAGLAKDETVESNQMPKSNIQSEDEIFDTGDGKKDSFNEAMKQHDLAIDEAPTAAATDFENYKKQNKNRTRSVYSGKGEFKTVLQDYDNPEYIAQLNSDMTLKHLENSDYIQKQVLPSIMNANAKLIDQKAADLIKKYNITPETSPDDPKYIQAQQEMDELQSKLFYNDKRVKDVSTAYYNELSRLHGIDKDGYMVDKHTKPWIKDLDLKWNNKGLPLSPMSLYNSVFSAGTDIKSVGAAGQAVEYQKRFNRYQSNLKLAEKNNWEDDMVGYENSNGDFKIQKKGTYPIQASGYTNKTTWGEHKKKMSQTIVDNEKRYKEDLAKILKRRDISSHYEKADFDKFASGDNSLRELSLMFTEQGFNMVGSIVTLGGLPSIMEGASIYETRVEDRAKEKFGFDDNEWAELKDEERIDYLYQAVLSDTENEDGTVAANTGFAIGMAETASSAFVLSKTGVLMKKGYGSLVKGQYKRFLKNTMKTGGTMVAGGFGEAITEGVQTAMSSAATGHWSWDEFRQAMGTGAVIGTIIPGGGNVVSSTVKETKATAETIASKWDKNSTENILNSHQKELDKAFKDGNINKEEYEEKSNIINDTRRSNDKIPSDFSVNNKKEAIDLLTKKISLQREIDKIDDKALAKGKQDEITEIDAKLEEVSVRDRFEKQQEKVEKVAGKIFGEDVKARNVTSEEAVTMAKKQTKEEYDLILEDLANPNINERQRKQLNDRKKSIENMIAEAGTSFGFYDPISKTMVLNKDASVAQGFVTTSSHEFLHAILQNTIKESPEIRAELGNALGKHLEKIDTGQLQDSEYAQRLRAYQGDPSNIQGEEMITLLSEAMQRGDIKYNESIFTKLKDTFRRLLQKFGKKIKFDTGEDVYNFIKDYNKSIESGKVSRGIKNLALKGADGKLITPTPTQNVKPTLKQSKADEVNRIYKEQGVKGAGIIASPDGPYRGMAEKIFERNLAFAPSQDIRENLINNKDFIIGDILYSPGTETAKARTVLGLVQDYPDYVKKQEKEEKKVAPLSGFINTWIGERSKEVFKPYGIDMAITKSMEQEGVAIEVGKIEAEDTTTEVKTKPKKKKIVLADRLGVKNKVDKAIKAKLPKLDVAKLNFKTLKNEIPNITGELFGISPKKLISGANITKKELQSAQMFINKNADILLSMLPEGATTGGTATGVPNTLLKAFYTKTDRAKMAKTGSKAGLAIQVKNPNISRSDFLQVFGIIDGKPNRTDRNTSARVLALANQTGKMMTNQSVREQLMKSKSYPFSSLGVLADGKSKVMFSKKFVGKKASEWAPGSVSGLQTPFTVITKNGSPRTGFRDTDAMFNMDMTWGQEGARILNEFLELNPQYRQLFAKTMTGGMRGGFFLTMPEFDKVISQSDKPQIFDGLISYRLEYNSKEKLTNKGVNIFNDPNFKKDQSKRYDILYDFFKDVESYLKNNKNDFWFFEELAKDTGKGQSAFSRVLAPYKFYPINKNKKPDQKNIVVEEHSRPQNTMVKAGLLAALDGRVDQEFKVIKASFMQGSFLKTDDDIVGRAKLGESMPDIFYTDIAPRIENGDLVLPDGLVAVVRLAAPGTKYAPVNTYETVDLNNYWLPSENKTIAEYFGVDGISDIALANEIIIESLAGVKTKGSGSVTYNFSKAIKNSRLSNESKGISVLDFDDTLATTKSNILTTAPDGTKGKMNAEQYAKNYEDLAAQGYTFDFSEFNKVVKGKVAPLFQKALKLQKKFGPENMFVLTARPPAAQQAIFEFLKANGLNIPLKNITGLANSTSEAKALWMADKVADGYNDFYFADDALQNVQAVKNMLDQFDVKSKVQQAKLKFSKDMSKTFNDIIQGSTGVRSEIQYSDAQAKIRGHRTKYKSIIPASAQDFAGLIYNFLGKGKKGEADMAFFKKALIDPFARGINELNSSRQGAANDYKNLQKAHPKVKKIINKKIPGTQFTNDQAVRVYLWDSAGFEIPGLSKRDLKTLVDRVNKNPDLKSFANGVGVISKKEEGYSQPGDFWLAENITSDLLSDGAIGDARSEFLNEWQQNVDVIFSPQNLNKIEAIYGSNFREALEDMLYRMKTGRNRPMGGGRLMNAYMNWLNNSVGAIMFFNMRSALLQTISAINFVNWSDNNPFRAAAAFANQPQYWKDFSMLFNSDYLKQRRAGNQRGINEAELSAAVAGAENKAKAAIAWLLKKGFLPTQIADSFAIASGGATFYRNRVKNYVKEGMTKEQAEKQAFLDFQETSEVAQQSARPDMISQQQASPLGRLILSFQNTPMQYARIINKAARDIANRRGDTKTHISKIIYYGVAQGILFGSLQSALFAALGDDDEEQYDKKKERILNQMVDSLLSGIGYGGKAISTVKNTLMEYKKQKDKKWNSDHAYTLLTLLGFSPPIGSKLRKIYGSIQTEEFNKGVFEKRGFTLDNPLWSAVGHTVEGFTNVPLGRLSNKMLNVDNAMDSNNEWWQRVALLMGWNTWDLGIKDKDIEAVKAEIKEEKKIEKKKADEIKKERKRVEEEKEKRKIETENKEKSKKDGVCSAVSRSGKRCKNKVVKGKLYCTIHEKVDQVEGGKKSQCKKIKSGGKRCKMQTSNKSGYCYYHD